MKKKHSVLYLSAMQTTLPILIILFVMTVTELIIFYRTGQRKTGDSLISVFEASKVFLISKAGCFLYFVTMICTKLPRSCAFTEYTLARLSISPGRQIFEYYIYNLLATLLFWSAQVMTYIGMYLIYVNINQQTAFSNQSFTLSIFHNGFLQSFMPIGYVFHLNWLIILLLTIPFMIIVYPFDRSLLRIVLSILFLIVVINPASYDQGAMVLGTCLPAACLFIVACTQLVTFRYTPGKKKGVYIEKTVSK